MRRGSKWWIAVAAVAALLLAGDTAYWAYAVRQLEAGFHAWIAAQRQAGWSTQTQGEAIGGWPAAATLTARDLVIAGGNTAVPGGLRWQAERLTLRVGLFDPHSLELRAGGVQRLRLGDAPEITLTGDEIAGTLPLQPDAPPRQASVTGRNLHAQAAGASGAGAALSVGELHANLDLHPVTASGETAAGFTADASGVQLPSTIRWALGARIASLRLGSALTGPIADAPTPAARATAWRDGGGSLVLRQLDLNWGPLALAATAHITLDARLQPAGTGTARITGYGATMDALAEAGVLSRSAALTAKALLSLMAQPAQDGEPSAVDVPLRLRDSTLFMRDVPLVRIPQLDWQAR